MSRGETGRTLWQIHFPADAVLAASEGVAPVLTGRTPEEVQSVQACFASVTKGPMSLDALEPMLRSTLGAEALAVLQAHIPRLSATLNDLLFERIGALSEEHFTPEQLQQALAVVRSPLWRSWNEGRNAFSALVAGELTRRWERERVAPLIAAYDDALDAGSALPEVQPLRADDTLARRLLELTSTEAVPRAWLAQKLRAWERAPETARVRERGLWERLTTQLLEHDGFWHEHAQAQLRGSLTDAQLARVVSFYESEPGKRFASFLPRCMASMEDWMKAPPFHEAFIRWIESVTEQGR